MLETATCFCRLLHTSQLLLSRMQSCSTSDLVKVTPLAKPTGGHRPLLMMSFFRRVALKSVTAAKKESVAKCAGPLPCGDARMVPTPTIKTIQCCAEADPTRVLVAVDLKAAFQNVSRRAMLLDVEQNDPEPRFSRWYTGSTGHRVHFESAHAKITANSGVDQGCPCAGRLLNDGAKLFAYLDDWYLFIKPHCLAHALPSPQWVPCSRIQSFQHQAIRFCGDLVRWNRRTESALGSLLCPSVPLSGESTLTATTSTTTPSLASDPVTKPLTFLCFFTSAPPTYLVPTASCAVSMRNKEGLSADITNTSECGDDVLDCDVCSSKSCECPPFSFLVDHLGVTRDQLFRTTLTLGLLLQVFVFVFVFVCHRTETVTDSRDFIMSALSTVGVTEQIVQEIKEPLPGGPKNPSSCAGLCVGPIHIGSGRAHPHHPSQNAPTQ